MCVAFRLPAAFLLEANFFKYTGRFKNKVFSVRVVGLCKHGASVSCMHIFVHGAPPNIFPQGRLT